MCPPKGGLASPPQWGSKDPKLMVSPPQHPAVLTSGISDCHGAGETLTNHWDGGDMRGVSTSPLHTPILLIQGFLPSTKETGTRGWNWLSPQDPPRLRQKREGEKGGLRGAPIGLGGPREGPRDSQDQGGGVGNKGSQGLGAQEWSWELSGEEGGGHRQERGVRAAQGGLREVWGRQERGLGLSGEDGRTGKGGGREISGLGGSLT